MEQLYNPAIMPDAEMKATFVARHDLLKELLALIAHQPEGAGVQHVLLLAPRGMGKTTMLLMLRLAIQEGALAEHWQAVRFAEESYEVSDLAELWREVLHRLATETGDAALQAEVEALTQRFPESEDLQEMALAVIKDWQRTHQKRLVLLIENFDGLLKQIDDERDHARLREVLMNDGTCMLIGAATAFFSAIDDYEQPLYQFFKVCDLAKLGFADIQSLLYQRAELDGRPELKASIEANPGRLRALTYFTGGNPRLVLMLYRILVHSELRLVRENLEKLLDEVTPFYKAKTEQLPAQPRKILGHMARISGKTHEGVTPTEIAQATRLSTNKVSAQLKRLADDRYVEAAPLRGRNSYYTLSEPLYAVWYQMRFGHESRQRLQWLVDFLKVWYEAEEMSTESTRLATRFRDFLHAGDLLAARNSLEHRRYFADALDDSPVRIDILECLIDDYLTLADTDIVKQELLPSIPLDKLSRKTLEALYKAGCISEAAVHQTPVASSGSPEEQAQAETLAALQLGLQAAVGGRMAEALQYFDSVVDVQQNIASAWYNRAKALASLGRHAEALASYDRAIALRPEIPEAWYNRGNALFYMQRYEEAITSYDRALVLQPDMSAAQHNRVLLYVSHFFSRLCAYGSDAARRVWPTVRDAAQHLEQEVWYELARATLLETALQGDLQLARELAAASGLEEPLFPLVRALDYLLTAPPAPALLANLSPEMRSIVEEIVRKLRPLACQAGQRTFGVQTSKSKALP